MEKKILSFNKFINEQENSGEENNTTNDAPNNTPETEREAKSRIAANIVKSIFGERIPGTTGGYDADIEETKEVKESLPYKGCGINEPYPLQKTPIPASGIKEILEHLQDKGIADYSRALNELKEKRAIIVGFRNKIDIKKESSNQDRFCDSLYFIPGGANTGTILAANKSTNNKDKKNEALEIIDERIREINYIYESSVWAFGEFDSLRKELEFLNESIDKLSNDVITVDEFINIYEDNKTKKSKSDKKTQKSDNKNSVSSSTGSDMIYPYQITTVPSLAYYGKKPLNPKGVGIKLPGDTVYFLQQRKLGSAEYKMMVEGEQVKVGRYPVGVTKYETYKPSQVYTENCGMQIHRSSTKGEGVCIGPWSAGCQVFSDYGEWQEFISKAEKESMNATKFLYALVQLDDVDPNVLESAMKGLKYTPVSATTTTTTTTKLSTDKKEDKAKKDSSISIQDLAKYIKKEYEAFNSDEKAVIKKYNQTIKSKEDVASLEKIYQSIDSKRTVWAALKNFLNDSEFKELKFRS